MLYFQAHPYGFDVMSHLPSGQQQSMQQPSAAPIAATPPAPVLPTGSEDLAGRAQHHPPLAVPVSVSTRKCSKSQVGCYGYL